MCVVCVHTKVISFVIITMMVGLMVLWWYAFAVRVLNKIVMFCNIFYKTIYVYIKYNVHENGISQNLWRNITKQSLIFKLFNICVAR